MKARLHCCWQYIGIVECKKHASDRATLNNSASDRETAEVGNSRGLRPAKKTYDADADCGAKQQTTKPPISVTVPCNFCALCVAFGACSQLQQATTGRAHEQSPILLLRVYVRIPRRYVAQRWKQEQNEVSIPRPPLRMRVPPSPSRRGCC